MRISMPRGDIKYIRFLVNDRNDVAVDIDFTEIYFTVKKNINNNSFVLQKKLSTGGITKIGFGDYQIKINPEDTNNLAVNTLRFPHYVFDIQLDYQGDFDLKNTFTGDFVLTPDVTRAENEQG